MMAIRDSRSTLPLSRAWLGFSCVMLLFFSLVSAACAIECRGAACAGMPRAVTSDQDGDNAGPDLMSDGDCVLCYSNISDMPALIKTLPLATMPYAFTLVEHVSYSFAPEPPPPRINSF